MRRNEQQDWVEKNKRGKTERARVLCRRTREKTEKATGLCRRTREETEKATGLGGRTREETERATGLCRRTREETEKATGLGGRTREETEKATGLCGRTREETEKATGLGGRTREETEKATGLGGRTREETEKATGLCRRTRGDRKSNRTSYHNRISHITGLPPGPSQTPRRATGLAQNMIQHSKVPEHVAVLTVLLLIIITNDTLLCPVRKLFSAPAAENDPKALEWSHDGARHSHAHGARDTPNKERRAVYHVRDEREQARLPEHLHRGEGQPVAREEPQRRAEDHGHLVRVGRGPELAGDEADNGEHGVVLPGEHGREPGHHSDVAGVQPHLLVSLAQGRVHVVRITGVLRAARESHVGGVGPDRHRRRRVS